jgi:hypothetical protein
VRVRSDEADEGKDEDADEGPHVGGQLRRGHGGRALVQRSAGFINGRGPRGGERTEAACRGEEAEGPSTGVLVGRVEPMPPVARVVEDGRFAIVGGTLGMQPCGRDAELEPGLGDVDGPSGQVLQAEIEEDDGRRCGGRRPDAGRRRFENLDEGPHAVSGLGYVDLRANEGQALRHEQ